MRTKITVTQEDIDSGSPRQANSCPVALAVSRKLQGTYVRAYGNEIIIGRNKYRTPTSVYDFIYNFDRHNPVEPFEFELEVPDAN